MRPPLPPLRIARLALVGAVALLAAGGCGREGVDRTTLLAQSRSEDLLRTLDRVETQLEAGECDSAASSVRVLRRKVADLPDRYDGELVGNLTQWVDHLDGRVDDDCAPAAEPSPSPTPSPSPSPTPSPTPTPTEVPSPSPTPTPTEIPLPTVEPTPPAPVPGAPDTGGALPGGVAPP